MTDRQAYWAIISRNFVTYIHGQLKSALAVGVLSTFALWLIGVRWPIVLGPIIGGLAAVPILGTGLGMVLGVVVAWAELGPVAAGWTFVGLVVVQMVDNWIVAPRIQGAGFGLRPLAALAIVLVGGALLAPVLGPFGPIFALPLAVVLRDLRRYQRLRTGGARLSVDAALPSVLPPSRALDS